MVRTFVLATSLVLVTGCATTTPEHLPMATPEADEAMIEAHAMARKAYDACLDNYVEDSVPWSLYVATGSGMLSAGLLGAAVTVAAIVPDPAVSGGGTAALGLASVAAAASATYFGTQAGPAMERADSQLKILSDGRLRTEQALGTGDASEMAQVGRSLYENCRAARATKNGAGTALVIRDLARYRRDLSERRAQVAGLAESREDLEKINESLGARLLDAEHGQTATSERLRTAEGKLAGKESENNALSARVGELEEEQASLSARQKKLLEEKRKLEAKTSHYEEVAAALKDEVETGKLQLRRLKNGVIVELPNAVLFASGKADLNDDGNETLQAVAGAIKDLSDRRVRVEGHTDDVPVNKGSAFEDNWNLSAQRALTVTRVLQEHGVDPTLLSAEARGEFAPAASNESDEGKAKNRRIEIYLVPRSAGSSEAWTPEAADDTAPAKGAEK